MNEQARQTKIKNKLKAEGWTVIKLIKTSMNGIPDLMCLKGGKTVFIEVKDEKGVISVLQKERINELKMLGFDVKVWTDYETEFKRI